ncbi:Os04g0341650 [Oryza sativa Japonica Group]|uniref:Os04g0341650 protein n=2 Tax=Oryza TaxID=4527 RepID=A0A0P0W8N8_ORYSJ|nr:Os04g0341650 [Oryza sativa Japonica Group]
METVSEASMGHGMNYALKRSIEDSGNQISPKTSVPATAESKLWDVFGEPVLGDFGCEIRACAEQATVQYASTG